MSSRRKSSNPCMVRVLGPPPKEQECPKEVMDVEASVDDDVAEKEQSDSPEPEETGQESSSPDQQTDPEPDETQTLTEPTESEDHVLQDAETHQRPVESDSSKKQSRGYECKYCPFSTQNLNQFKEHVDSRHPNVILNPQYVCAVCNFNTNKFDSLSEHNDNQHPGESNFKFKRIRTKSQTVLQQTIEGRDNSAECEVTHEHDDDSGVLLAPCISATLTSPDSVQPLLQGGELDGLIHKDQVAALNINGTVVIPEPTILQGLSHVAPLLQRPPNFNSVPKIAVPLNTTKYNPSLDDNLTLITSFNKFPYPTHAELSWLTAASKHPEEQIKVWFTTQRLKQGITWSPEEVEEARKKMFNGSIPPAHHTFTVLPTIPVSQPSAKASQQPVVHTTVEHPGQVRTSTSNGTHYAVSANASTGFALKRSLPAPALGPESKRPVMAVAPHSGDSRDKTLMAPPPPPLPQKERLPMAPPLVPMEMKRSVAFPLVLSEMKRPSAAVPLMPPPSSSSLSKGKLLPTQGNVKTKPLVSLPSMVFPESLTRPTIAPPPIFAPPFQNSLIVPRICSKEKHHALPAADAKLPNSPPLVGPQTRRPTIIQSIRAPAKTLSQIPGFPLDSKKLKEQQGVELNVGYACGDQVISPLAEAHGANGTSRCDAKWSNDQPAQNNGLVHVDGGDPPKTDYQQKVLTQFPLLERMKGKTAEQLKVLEENFMRNSFPTHGDVDNLAVTTRLSHQEIDSWFTERRALRDNLEQALLNSMGAKRMATVPDKRVNQQPASLQLNGVHKSSMDHLKSPAPPSHPSALAPSLTNPAPCSVPPDGRSLALLKDDFAQTRWPSPEELSQTEGRMGLVRTDIARWFSNSRSGPPNASMDLMEELNNSGVNGGQGLVLGSPETPPPGIIQRGQDGGLKNNSQVLEAELGWLMEQRPKSLSARQQEELQEQFTGRLRQQNGVVGVARAREVLGTCTEDGRSRRDRDLLLDRESKMAEDATGRLTG